MGQPLTASKSFPKASMMDNQAKGGQGAGKNPILPASPLKPIWPSSNAPTAMALPIIRMKAGLQARIPRCEWQPRVPEGKRVADVLKASMPFKAHPSEPF